MPNVLIIAGDLSADHHAAELVRDLRRKEPGIRVMALGGSSLQSVADRFVYPLVGVGGFGFWEPLLKMPQLWNAYRRVTKILDQERPDIVIPVDYYGFNIHVARAAHERGIPVLYYISPQVWASRPGRIQKLKQVVNQMLVIFPFEKDLYQRADVPVTFVGHPLVEHIPKSLSSFQNQHIGLMPGSRPSVMARHLPILGETAAQLKKEFPNLTCSLIRPAEVDAYLYQSFSERYPWIPVVSDADYKHRQTLSLAITVSGTTSLENALLGIPMIVMYRLSRLTYEIAKRLIRIPFIAIPNILENRAIVPELIQEHATPPELAKAAAALLRDEKAWLAMREALLALRERLQGKESSAADEILKIISQPEALPASTTHSSTASLSRFHCEIL